MTGPDIAILIVILISSILSWMRGVIRELISLAAWAVALFVTFSYSHKIAQLLPDSVASPIARTVISSASLFFGSLFIGWLAGALVKKLLSAMKMSYIDRALGLFFGMIRGSIIVSVVVLLLNLTALPDEPWWKESLLLPRFQKIAQWAHQRLPPDLGDHFRFPTV